MYSREMFNKTVFTIVTTIDDFGVLQNVSTIQIIFHISIHTKYSLIFCHFSISILVTKKDVFLRV